MSKLMKRSLALFLVLVSCISFLPIISLNASAAEVSYVYDGKYIYNWGTRGEVATFLSPNAKKFYENNNASYDVLSSYSGGTGTSGAPTSELYYALQKLMVGAHSYKTSYEATKDLYQYTDCQGGGGKISSFYSGTSIGPGWGEGGSWNREHTWPDSKGLGGSDENDIMMLRPTSTSENGSRGNKAYGKSSGYYNPNSESGGKYDLRGDVARIFLYVYVRWGNVNGNGSYSTWGSNGVMESIDVMLEWMEADPVDTWELGRNDSVESITGTRNVFVDYPELAFLLFNEEIPEGMTTPSGESGQSCDHNNFNSGVIVVATCTSNGYTLYTCQTVGCGYSYKANVTNAKGHNYVAGSCVNCGEVQPSKPVYVNEFTTGVPYKLGFFSSNKNAEYYFTGTMSTTNSWYGATDTAYENGVDVYVEAVTGGYRLYFQNTSGQKQYINLVQNDTHYNFTYSSTATSVFTWDTEKYAFKTTVGSEICYIGNYGDYVNIGTLLNSKYKDTDYIARMYTISAAGGGTSDGGETPKLCTHSYYAVVTLPTCTKAGFTTYTCSLCNDTYTDDEVAARGHRYQNGTCTECGAAQPTGSQTSGATATVSFTDKANRTVFNTSQQVWVQNGVTITNNKKSSTVDVADYSDPARFYAASEVIISYSGMTKIEINCTGLESKYVSGWLNVPAGATATNNNGIVTVVFSTPVDSITYASLSAQSRAYDITVYTEAGGSSSCTHNIVVDSAVDPTCTSTGLTEGKYCSICNEVIVAQKVVSALEHNWLDATTEAPKTCNRCGLTEGDKLPDDTPDDNQTPDNSETPDNGETPDDDETPDGGETTEKDHSQCKAEASGWKRFWNGFCNFFRSIFTGKKKCTCGEILG